MNLTRCSNGHYYDASKHRGCPHCGIQHLNLDVGKTMPRGGMAEELLKTERKVKEDNPVEKKPEARDSQKTVGLIQKQMGIDPVVGWLVCIKGREKGRDYRIRSEKNYIGRSSKMDICIDGDEAISRENHAIISYNPKNNSFRLYPGDGRGIVYLNGEEVFQPELLKAQDSIELGETKFLFVPFCGEVFRWTEEEASGKKST